MARKSKPEVVTEVPEGAVDATPGAPDPVELTRQATGAITPWASKSVIEFHPTLAEIAKMRVKYTELLAANDVKTEEGYGAVKQALRTLTPLRTAVDARRLEEGRQARDYVARVNAAGNTIIERIAEIEAPLAAALKAEDARQTEEALAKALAIEAEQRRKEDERLALIAAEEKRKKDEADAELARREAAIEEQRKALEAQQADFKRQQDELQRQQEEVLAETKRLQREAQDRIDAENKRLEDAKQEERRKEEAAEQEKRRQEEEARRTAQAEQDRIATEARVKKAAEDAAALAVKNEQARVAREVEAARVKAEKEAAAEAKKLAKAPDVEKIKQWRESLRSVIKAAPVCKDGEAIQFVGRLKKSLIEAEVLMAAFVEAK